MPGGGDKCLPKNIGIIELCGINWILHLTGIRWKIAIIELLWHKLTQIYNHAVRSLYFECRR